MGSDGQERIAAVVIGRNEGARLVACLRSTGAQVGRVVYVDSGSTDGSVEAARSLGADVVTLDPDIPFTAARARNAGLDALAGDVAAYVQFVDGDCTLEPDWVARATAFLETHPEVAVVCGRRRERHPERSVYNRLCDREWDTPVGAARACGGDALARFEAVAAVGGFTPELIAGEEPDLCLRLRGQGWTVWRLDAEMTRHDAEILRFGQWWRRSRRAGHAFAEGAARHGAGPEAHWVAETRRALLWGAALPLAALAATLALGPWGLAPLALYPAQVLRLATRAGAGKRANWEWALFVTLGKIPEALGVLGYGLGRLTARRARLIEYK